MRPAAHRPHRPSTGQCRHTPHKGDSRRGNEPKPERSPGRRAAAQPSPAGLLAPGSSPNPRLPISIPRQWRQRAANRVTVAPPQRIFTAFPKTRPLFRAHRASWPRLSPVILTPHAPSVNHANRGGMERSASRTRHSRLWQTNHRLHAGSHALPSPQTRFWSEQEGFRFCRKDLRWADWGLAGDRRRQQYYGDNYCCRRSCPHSGNARLSGFSRNACLFRVLYYLPGCMVYNGGYGASMQGKLQAQNRATLPSLPDIRRGAGCPA